MKLGRIMFKGFKHAAAAADDKDVFVAQRMVAATGISREALYKYKQGKNRPQLSAADVENFARFCVHSGASYRWARDFLKAAGYFGSAQFESRQRFLQNLFPYLRLQESESTAEAIRGRENAGIQHSVEKQNQTSWSVSSRPLPLGSRFYIQREQDAEAYQAFAPTLSTLLSIQGPRQCGKSSLLLRLAAEARRQGKRTILLDFRLLDLQESVDGFFQEFCRWVADELSLPDKTAQYWSRTSANPLRATRFIQREILSALDSPLTILIDDVDHLFWLPYYASFFTMLRSWHDLSAYHPQMKKLSLALATSTEPSMFITDLEQSPFNVGHRFLLEDFSTAEIRELAQLHDVNLSLNHLQDLEELTGGQPYLTQLAISYLRQPDRTPERLFQVAADPDGPFADFLESLLRRRLLRDPELVAAWRSCLQGEAIPDAVGMRLEHAGIVKRANDRFVPRCLLYQTYFMRNVDE